MRYVAARSRSTTLALRVLGLFAAALLLAANASAQLLRTQTFSDVNGLPSSECWGLAQGPRGRLAVATRAGIGIYDGQDWEQVLCGEELPITSGCSQVAFDERGRLWTSGSYVRDGVAMRDESGGWRHVARRRPEPPIRVVRMELLPGEGGTVAVLLDAAGELHFFDERGEDSLPKLPEEPFGEVRDLCRDGEALLVLEPHRLRELRLVPGPPSPWLEAELPEEELFAIALEELDLEQRLWWLSETDLGWTDSGGLHLRAVRSRTPDRTQASEWNLEPDGRGGALFGAWTQLDFADGAERAARHLGPSSGLVAKGASALLRDLEDNVWVASLRGLTRVALDGFETFDARHGLLEDEVSAILEVAPGVLLLGHPSGLSLWSEEGSVAMPIDLDEDLDPHSVRVMDLAAGEDGELWAAVTSYGLYRRRADRSVESVDLGEGRRAYALWMHADGRLLVGTSRGVVEVSPESGAQRVLAGSESTAIRRLLVDSAGDLYAATAMRGVLCWRGGPDGEFSGPLRFVSERGGGRDSVYSLLEWSPGVLLVGTADGLCELHEGRLVYSKGSRTERVAVYALLRDADGRGWAGTNRGLVVWDRHSCTRYTVLDGLAGQEVNRAALVQSADGTLWVGTNRGLSRLRPNSSLHPGVATLSGVRAFSEGEAVADEALPSHSDVEFQFDLIHLSQREPRVRARLLGYEEEFGPERRLLDRRLRYTNLPAGEYRLELQARTLDGEWGASSFSQPILVKPPLFLRPWFIALALAALFTLGVVIVSWIGAHRRARSLSSLARERATELAESERRYKELFTRTLQAQLIVEPASLAVLDANPAACRFLDLDSREVLGRGLQGLLPLDAERLAATLGELRDPEHDEEVVLRSEGAGSSPRGVLELRASAYSRHGQRVAHVTLRDISLELELEENLREAQKLRAVGELAGGIAHDFNNLLTTIGGFAELIEEELDEASHLRAHAEEITTASERGAELVSQLLAVGGKQELELERLDLAALARDFAGLLRRLLEPEIEVRVEEELRAGWVLGDRASLERVLMNLALNARDALPAGGWLTLRSRREERGGASWSCVDVEDNGVGMDEETLARVVEPFFTTKPPGRGTGLGLAVSHGIVAQCGGELSVRSELGGGTCVTLAFPGLNEGQPEEPASSLGVLVVDDEVAVRELVRVLASKLGHEVTAALDAREALTRLESGDARIDVLLTDVRMPGLSGPELAEQARELRPELAVVLMSGYASRTVALEGSPWLQKPFDAAQLERALRAATARRTSEPVHSGPRGDTSGQSVPPRG